MVPLIYAGVNGLLDPVAVDSIVRWDAEFQEHLKTQQQPLLEEISKGVMTKDIEAKIKKVRLPPFLPPCLVSLSLTRAILCCCWQQVVQDHVAAFTA